MSLLVQRLLYWQPRAINNLCSAFRNLNVKPWMLQQQNVQIADEPSQSKDVLDETNKECREVFNQINSQVANGKEGRLFAVIHLCGKQFKVTPGDIILVEGYWPPTIGDEIRLEKVLLAAAKDFTLIGRPLLDEGLVNVYATIIEKTLTHTKTHFKKKRRKQYTRINFQRAPNTMIRINSIEIGHNVNESLSTINKDRLF